MQDIIDIQLRKDYNHTLHSLQVFPTIVYFSLPAPDLSSYSSPGERALQSPGEAIARGAANFSSIDRGNIFVGGRCELSRSQ